MLCDSGGRIGEILSLQRKNISFDERGAVVVVDGKTGSGESTTDSERRARLIGAVRGTTNLS